MKPMILPVIHYADDDQAMRSAAIAFDAGCEGVLLIHMEGRNDLLPRVAAAIKERWPGRLVGLNLLGVDPVDAVRIGVGLGLDMTWTDEQPTHSALAPWGEVEAINLARNASPDHAVLVGVAFKHQRPEPDPGAAARRAVEFGLVPTTSGAATGVAAEVDRIAALRQAIGADAPLGIASGVTPRNARDYAPHLTHILVATGVSRSFHEFDADLLAELVAVARGERP